VLYNLADGGRFLNVRITANFQGGIMIRVYGRCDPFPTRVRDTELGRDGGEELVTGGDGRGRHEEKHPKKETQVRLRQQNKSSRRDRTKEKQPQAWKAG
jgi:hypothetical protein